MKTKLFIFLFIAGFVCFSACEDSALDVVGMEMLPDSDKIVVFDTIFNITGKTVALDSIYAKSKIGYLGKFYDPDYGEIKSGYMCQYFPSHLFELDSIIGERGYEIDSVRLDLYYYTSMGDSLTPMEVTVYPLTGDLEKNYYTASVNKDIVGFDNPWGKQTYTARNLNISDSLYNANAGYYYRQITISLPREVGQELFEKVRADDVLTSSSATNTQKKERFVQLFPGTYFESTFGTGNIINIERSRITSYYDRRYTLVDTLGVSSVVDSVGYASYTWTSEVTLVNTFENKYDEHLLLPNDEIMYLKTPGSAYSQITIPIPEIIKKVGNKKFSNIQLSLEAYSKSDWEYALNFPGDESTIADPLLRPRLLLIEQDSLKTFFENQYVADSYTSYSTTYSSSSNTYTFSNISNVVQNAINKAPGKDLDLLLIPIQTDAIQGTTSSNTTYYTDYASYHYLQPSGVALKKGGNRLQIKVVATNLEVNQ